MPPVSGGSGIENVGAGIQPFGMYPSATGWMLNAAGRLEPSNPSRAPPAGQKSPQPPTRGPRRCCLAAGAHPLRAVQGSRLVRKLQRCLCLNNWRHGDRLCFFHLPAAVLQLPAAASTCFPRPILEQAILNITIRLMTCQQKLPAPPLLCAHFLPYSACHIQFSCMNVHQS